MYGNSERKPTSPALQVQPKDTDPKESDAPHDPNEDNIGRGEQMDRTLEYQDDFAIQNLEENRVKREAPTQPRNLCVIGEKLKLIDRETVILTVTCAPYCKEIKRVFFLKDREDPLTFVVDCKK